MKAAIGERFSWDDPDNCCFGCSSRNPYGLRLSFTRTGEQSIRCDYSVAAHYAGAPGVVHGGIQAALLDEVLGTTAHTAFVEHVSASLVTADFSLRYRSPVPVETPIAICGELVRVEGRNLFVAGRIEDASGHALTTAEARWCRLEGIG